VPTFKAIVVEKSDSGQKVCLTDFDEANLMEGDVTVRVEWSTVNYKDGLALTGKAHGRILHASAMEAGRQGHPQWLGVGRDPSRRLRGKGTGQGQLAGAIARAQ
jgi:NADPH:quinone reductase-like Zn-dependent oxidoreductase